MESSFWQVTTDFQAKIHLEVDFIIFQFVDISTSWRDSRAFDFFIRYLFYIFGWCVNNWWLFKHIKSNIFNRKTMRILQ